MDGTGLHCMYIYTRHICIKDKQFWMDGWVSALMDGKGRRKGGSEGE